MDTENDFVEIDKNGEEIIVVPKRDGYQLGLSHLPKTVSKMEENTQPSYYGTYENDYSKLKKNEIWWSFRLKRICCCL